jgi:peptide/nickel transport system permease protein
MRTFVLRRLLVLVPLLLTVTFITQTLLVLSPGNYLTILLMDPHMTDRLRELLRHQYHLDSDNIFVRYWFWLWNALRGDFGYSYHYSMPVWSLVWQRMFNTLMLTVAALGISWGTAIPLGSIAAVKRGTWIDKAIGGVSFFGLSIPAVFLSLLLLLFAKNSGWFPIGGVHDDVNWDYFSPLQKIGDTLWHLALPSLVLGVVGMGQYVRQMRAEMIETLGHDYIRTARAKGLTQSRIVIRHALGNAINPLISLFGFSLAYLLAGAILTEKVFSWPGMGRLTFEALTNKDEPLVMASVVLITLMLVMGSLVSDLLLGIIDPRIRLEGH